MEQNSSKYFNNQFASKTSFNNPENNIPCDAYYIKPLTNSDI
jgi:hypothetical protein